MAKIAEVQEVRLTSLVPYERNAKIHGPVQIEKLKDSIREFGFLSPCLIDREYNVIAGHGRIQAAKELGMKTVPCIFIDGLTEAQRKAYILADNKLTEMGDWDMVVVMDELTALLDENFNLDVVGFELDGVDDWFQDRERWDSTKQAENEEYNEFLEKFEIKKTTDDCYTPDKIYEAVAEWVAAEYGVDKDRFVRPFFPGGDYETYKYPDGAVVVDNPPFSILSAIVDFYVGNGIKFFLFAPGLSTLNYVGRKNVCAICVYAAITYENGADVVTSFITNLDDDTIIARVTPDLCEKISAVNKENNMRLHKQMPKYEFPDEVLTAAKAGWLGKYGQKLNIKRSECVMIRELDAMKEIGKGIFGNALLLSERATSERVIAEQAAAERAAAPGSNGGSAYKWELSERERAIVKGLGEACKVGD